MILKLQKIYNQNKEEFDITFFEKCIMHQVLLDKRKSVLKLSSEDKSELIENLNSSTFYLYAQVINMLEEIPEVLISKLIEILIYDFDKDIIYKSKIIVNLNRIFGFERIEDELQKYFDRATDQKFYLKIMFMFINNDFPIFGEDDEWFNGKIACKPEWYWNKHRFSLTSKTVDYHEIKPYINRCTKLWNNRIYKLSNYYLRSSTYEIRNEPLYMLIKRNVEFTDNAKNIAYKKARHQLDLWGENRQNS